MANHNFRTLWVAFALATTIGCQAGGAPEPAAPLRTLLLEPLGTGGRIVSDPPGLDCPGACSAMFPLGYQLTLTAIAEPSFVFDSWSQGCSGSDPRCLFSLTDAMRVSFSFKPAAQGCPPELAACGAQCVDTSSDPSNCGGCNIACATGESCMAAACVALPPTCDAPLFLCGSQCVDTAVDQGNCGACGNACALGESCLAGTCTPIPCNAPNLQCGALCVDPQSDQGNCGSCGNACGAGAACVGATCVNSGMLQFSALWDRPGDLDLLVTTPTGNTVYFRNAGPDASTDFGQMDRNDTTGVGPENIFWSTGTSPPAGTYHVCLETAAFTPAPDTGSPLTGTVRVQLANSAPVTFSKTFTQPSSLNGSCDPALDTFVMSINYP